jgi:hypothetical protein
LFASTVVELPKSRPNGPPDGDRPPRRYQHYRYVVE